MSNLNEYLTFNVESAYENAYDLTVKRNYSTPKIYTATGDLKKRWYVYFSYREPITGKMKRVTPFYGDAHKYKTKEDRLFVLSAYRKKIIELLQKGYSPFEDNTELHKKYQTTKPKISAKNPKKKVVTTPSKKRKINEVTSKTIKQAFDMALNLKKNTVGVTTYKGYYSRVKSLQDFIVKKYPDVVAVHQLSKTILVQFLNEVLIRTSPRSRNNYRIDLSSVFQTLVDNEIIPTNFIKNIPVLKSNPERHKTYTDKQQLDIFNYLEDKDPILLLFIKFIAFNLLRPIEICRIKIKDINITQKTISFKAKNKPLKTKIIPKILIECLPDITTLNPESYLFTPTKIGGDWHATERNKRGHFSKRFKEVVKAHFNLGNDYGLYSFRHTYITKLYRELVKDNSPYEAKSRLMLITGHSSMEALEKYLRDIDAELPEDYSDLIRTK
jgi:integrase